MTYEKQKEIARMALERGETSEERYDYVRWLESGGLVIIADFERAVAAIMSRLEEEEE